jgi:hypothetical protein
VADQKAGTKIDNRGKGGFDGKRLAAHYHISLRAMYNILKQGNLMVDTAAKKRSGAVTGD